MIRWLRWWCGTWLLALGARIMPPQAKPSSSSAATGPRCTHPQAILTNPVPMGAPSLPSVMYDRWCPDCLSFLEVAKE